MSELLSLAFVSMVLALAVPYVLAALAGCLSERGGVIDLALEAKLLAGALAAASVAHGTGSIVLGALAGALAGALVGAAQAALIQRGGANPVIVGVGLNLVALGGTRYLLGVLYGDSTSSPPTPPLGSPLLGSPSAWLALLAALAVPWWLARTRGGLRLRVAGDAPRALRAAGVSTTNVRTRAVVLGSALAGAGGAQLSLSVGLFSAEMSAGRGYLALVAVILAGWRPGRAVLLALLIGLVPALAVQLQLQGAGLPRELLQLLPYVIAMLVLAGFGATVRAPAALGKASDD
jgi:ABC-type uncharacterized transport system permease subunit